MPATLTLTDALADQLAAAVERGVPFEIAAQAASIPIRTVYGWLEIAAKGFRTDGATVSDESKLIIERFGQRIATARARFEAKQLESIAQAGQQVNAKTGLTDWRAPAWILNNHPQYRARYRQERVQQIEHSGAVHHEHTLAQQADDDQLRAWSLLELPASGESGG